MIQALKHSLVLTAFAVVVVCGSVHADDGSFRDIKLSAVPTKVREVVDKMAPKADWTKIAEAKEDNQPVYLLQGKDHKGRLVGIGLFGNGKLIEFNAVIGAEDLPESVKKSIDKFAPKAKLNRIARIVEGDQSSYSIFGKNAGGRRIRLSIDPDGTITQSDTEIDREELPKPLLKSILSCGENEGAKIIHCWKILKKNDHPAGFTIDLIGADGEQFVIETADDL